MLLSSLRSERHTNLRLRLDPEVCDQPGMVDIASPEEMSCPFSAGCRKSRIRAILGLHAHPTQRPGTRSSPSIRAIYTRYASRYDFDISISRYLDTSISRFPPPCPAHTTRYTLRSSSVNQVSSSCSVYAFSVAEPLIANHRSRAAPADRAHNPNRKARFPTIAHQFEPSSRTCRAGIGIPRIVAARCAFLEGFTPLAWTVSRLVIIASRSSYDAFAFTSCNPSRSPESPSLISLSRLSVSPSHYQDEIP